MNGNQNWKDGDIRTVTDKMTPVQNALECGDGGQSGCAWWGAHMASLHGSLRSGTSRSPSKWLWGVSRAGKGAPEVSRPRPARTWERGQSGDRPLPRGVWDGQEQSLLVCPWRLCWGPRVCVPHRSRGNAAQVYPGRQDAAGTRPSGRPKDGVRKKQAPAKPVSVLSERDCEPPGQRRDRGRRRPPGPGGALHVRAPRHGGPDRGEGMGSALSLAGCTWQEG